MPDSQYQKVLDYLYSFIDYETMQQPRNISYFDLRRMHELLMYFDNPHLKARTIHIAGTKGKGSTAAMMASVLSITDYKTGLYTSPHLIDLRERFRVDGKLISEIVLIDLVDRIKPIVELVNQEAKYGRLTTFELLTTLAFLYFSHCQVDFQIIETGLGGRLDATNVVHPEICVITAIDFDHLDVLGNSLISIATEKAGIIKHGSVVVSSPQPSEAASVIEEKCLESKTRLIRVGKDVFWRGIDFESNAQLIEIKGRLKKYRIALPLLGGCQQENATAAVAALEVLVENGANITHENIVTGLENVSWPGRFQIIKQKPLVVIDGAHNQASIHQFKLSLASYKRNCIGFQKDKNPFNRAILIIGVSADKDIASIVSELFLLFNRVIATRSQHPRAMAPNSIAAEFGKYGFEANVTDSVPEAISLALSEAGERDIICITGSLFVAGEAIEYLSAD
ncbi:MAG: bifunctional folylpolyglutamate synthase/dihydrofolate synthase [Dehalococcoidia bacterium]|nr:MAG: bifunctional folylpolyglutamate synthase/dihydrofolate synthase [Dehalococcoidia bacterium]